MSELTEDRVREIVCEELDQRKATTRARLNDQLAKWRADRERAAQTPTLGEVTPARRDDSTDRDGRGPAEESTT
ncbi:hypothetical protein IU459_12070 [Nocardia amamiensis]|uniref:Uncharacterized protein n=1 Tax=Nocardia amamiensis TaxID=404578 RepID=A0ABS0CR51_9NOCA|nr:hypothetical protein [Nocardia amamiensis]MBF6298278.1 hypothetical protein [Nocardia amamiensis]